MSPGGAILVAAPPKTGTNLGYCPPQSLNDYDVPIVFTFKENTLNMLLLTFSVLVGNST